MHNRVPGKSFLSDLVLRYNDTFNSENKTTKPPLCLSLSDLQKKASSLYGLSAKKTLETAQSLYEKHKATTYPRTDCSYLPESQFEESNEILDLLVKINPF